VSLDEVSRVAEVLRSYGESVEVLPRQLSSLTADGGLRYRFLWCSGGIVVFESVVGEDAWMDAIDSDVAESVMDEVDGAQRALVATSRVGLEPVCGIHGHLLCLGWGSHFMFAEYPLERAWRLVPVHESEIWTFDDLRLTGRWFAHNAPSMKRPCSREIFPTLKVRGLARDGEATHPAGRRIASDLGFATRFAERVVLEEGCWLEAENYRGAVLTLRSVGDGATLRVESAGREQWLIHASQIGDALSSFAAGTSPTARE